jgi:oligopeptide/dipeptide ABC transporter ATP-binding protein
MMPAELESSAVASEVRLRVDDLCVNFRHDGEDVRVVENVSFEVRHGEILGLVGESGCGKSVTSMSLLRLLASPPAQIVAGSALFDGDDLLRLSEKRLRALRGNRIAMIFQEPMTSLNPLYTVGYQLTEVLRLHRGLNRLDALPIVVDMLRQVGLTAPDRRLNQYPHELSGGIRQRVMIAMALLCGPDLLIADEPTTALDVTIQAQILTLLRNMNQRYGAGILLITHDLGVVAEMCQRVMVMYAGRIVEQGPVTDLFSRPRHPYTHGLLRSIPRLESPRDPLPTIPGFVLPPGKRGKGCHFAGRCDQATQRCSIEAPMLTADIDNAQHQFACWNPCV